MIRFPRDYQSKQDTLGTHCDPIDRQLMDRRRTCSPCEATAPQQEERTGDPTDGDEEEMTGEGLRGRGKQEEGQESREASAHASTSVSRSTAERRSRIGSRRSVSHDILPQHQRRNHSHMRYKLRSVNAGRVIACRLLRRSDSSFTQKGKMKV